MKTKRFNAGSFNAYALALVALTVLGIFSIWVVGRTIIRSEPLSLAHRAATVAAGVSPSDLAPLTVTAADAGTPAYEKLKESMRRIKGANDDIRFVYLLTLRPEGVTFIGDSEDPSSEDYSAPGDVYYEASDAMHSVFDTKQTVVEGPTPDRWGTWVSGIAPILDANGDVIAIAGLDIDAHAYYRAIFAYTAIPFLLTIVMIIIALSGQRLRAKEEELFRTKFRFLSIASHELRSPLVGIEWGAEDVLSHEMGLSEKGKRLMTLIRDAARYMSETVGDILSTTRADASASKKLLREVVDLAALLRETARMLALGAEKEGIDVVFERGFPEHLPYPADKEKMRRIFSNIIGNALKYSHPKSLVTVSYGRDKEGYVISVADQGIGIPKEDQPKIFTTYYRAKNAERHNARGTGMGLYFTKELVELHGGRIWFESEEGAGTIVHVFLPDMKQGDQEAHPHH